MVPIDASDGFSFEKMDFCITSTMSDDVFDGHVLAEKLAKLNSSQQSIESLSRFCISNRKKAKQIVETWDKSFKSAQTEQRVSLLYLANDILQNSRRKGSEFVNEFWKVLPAALKHIYENGDEPGKKAATRLVDIWDERRVFGSRGQNLKNEILGKKPIPQLVSNGKSSNPIKIVKRDAHSLRIKLAVGCLPEKILSAFQLVHDENINDATVLNNCEAAVHRVGDLERDVESAPNQDFICDSAKLQGSALIDEIQLQEHELEQCVVQLESAEASRASLILQLKEALQDQELKVELIRAQLQAARGQIQKAASVRRKLISPPLSAGFTTTTNQPVEVMSIPESSLQSVPAVQKTSVGTSKGTDDEKKKAAAAAVAAKLSASASSAQMLTSVLSSLVAEEAASISGGFTTSGFPPGFPPPKRPKLEKPMPVSQLTDSESASLAYFNPLQLQALPNASTVSTNPVSQSTQTSFPPPPPPPLPPGNPPGAQFVQSSGLMMGMTPFGFGSSSLPPPPPLPSHISMGLMRPAPPQQDSLQAVSQQQQQTVNGGYYLPPGIGFYAQGPRPNPPTVPRQ